MTDNNSFIHSINIYLFSISKSNIDIQYRHRKSPSLEIVTPSSRPPRTLSRTRPLTSEFSSCKSSRSPFGVLAGVQPCFVPPPSRASAALNGSEPDPLGRVKGSLPGRYPRNMLSTSGQVAATQKCASSTTLHVVILPRAELPASRASRERFSSQSRGGQSPHKGCS